MHTRECNYVSIEEDAVRVQKWGSVILPVFVFNKMLPYISLYTFVF
jgi:hypothetical protein